MKSTRPIQCWGIYPAGTLLIAGALWVGQLCPSLQAQNTNTAPPAPVETPAAAASKAATPPVAVLDEKAVRSAVPSAGIQAIVKLAEAGVSKEVILKFVETSSLVRFPSASDLVTLKQSAVDDEVVVALLTRGASVEGRAIKENATVAVPAIVKALSTGGKLDPDSYDFWYYHYAYPRALSYSYRTLTPYVQTYSHRGSNPFRLSSRNPTGMARVQSSRDLYDTAPRSQEVSGKALYSTPAGALSGRKRSR